MKMTLISDNIDTLTGLRLVGIEGVIVHTPEEFRGAVGRAVADKDVGILLISEKLTTLDEGYVNEIKLKFSIPLIVEMPDRHGTGRSPDFISNYVRQAIGLKL